MPKAMTSKQFAAALEALGVSRNQAGDLLGIGRSSVFRYLRGEQEVPTIVERLIALLRKHGVPEEWRA